ncbi:MAG: hypothetical protein LBQ02_00950 [Candidatus Nomurabacteria bacterium]|jgi:DNA-directed RNA polymerase sigma subunit (sigma70/sigma32)|nr:hypothetical protein [Candidatus Nomurabacteria bacterium]
MASKAFTPTQRIYKKIFAKLPERDLEACLLPQLIAIIDRILTARESEVVKAVCGLNQDKKLAKQLGEQLGISRYQVHEIYYLSIRKLYCRGAKEISTLFDGEPIKNDMPSLEGISPLAFAKLKK